MRTAEGPEATRSKRRMRFLRGDCLPSIVYNLLFITRPVWFIVCDNEVKLAERLGREFNAETASARVYIFSRERVILE